MPLFQNIRLVKAAYAVQLIHSFQLLLPVQSFLPIQSVHLFWVFLPVQPVILVQPIVPVQTIVSFQVDQRQLDEARGCMAYMTIHKLSWKLICHHFPFPETWKIAWRRKLLHHYRHIYIDVQTVRFSLLILHTSHITSEVSFKRKHAV